MVQMAKSSPMKYSSKPHARKVSTSQPSTKKADRKNTERVNSDRKTESKDDEDFEMEAEEEEEEVVATTKQGELQRECKLCSKIYSSVYLLRRHVENVHAETKPRPFQCELCDYAATNKWNLKEHYRSHTVDDFMDFSDEDVPNESKEKDKDSDFVMSASEEEEEDREEEIKSASEEKSKPQGSRRSSLTVGKRTRYMDLDKDLESSEDDYVPYNYVAAKRHPKTKRSKKASVSEEVDEELEEEEEDLTPKKKLGRGKAEKEEESSDEDDVDGDDGDGDKSSGKGRDKVEKVRDLKSKHRPPCMCGKKCYRKDPFHSAIFHMNFGKNPEHFAEFSHPGDGSYAEQSDLEDDNIPDCWVRMTRIQESPLLATSIQYQRRELHRKCKIMGGDTESESVPLKDSTTQTDVNSTAARVGTETLNLNQTPDEFNSVCVKIDTDEWDNMATDFYSKCAKSEQVLREEMHQDNNKLNGFNLVHEQSEKTGCLEMVQDSTRQDGFPSACVDSEQMGCDVTHQNVTRQAGSNPDRVHSKQIDDSNTYTAENGLHSAGVKTTQMDHDCNHNVPMDSNYEKDEPVLQLNSQWKSISVGQIGLSPLSSQPQYYLLQEPQMVTMVTTAQTRQCLATAAPVFDEIQDAGDEILDEHKLSTSVVQVLPMSSNPSESQDNDVSLPMSSAICNMAEVSMTAEEVTSNLVEESGECSSDDFEEIFIETREKNKKTSKIYQSTLSALKRVRAQGSSRGVDKPTGASVREDLEDEGHDYHSNPEVHVCMKCQAEFLDQDKLIIHQKDCLKPVMLLFDDHSMKSENQSDHCHLNGYNSQKQASGDHTEEQEVDDSSSMNQSNEYSSCKAADEVDTADKHINFEIPNSDGKESDYNKSLDEEGEDNEYQRPRKLELSEKIKANPTAADIAAYMLQLSSLEPTIGTSASSNVMLEPIEANKVAVAQFADNNPDQEKDIGKLQAALFNLQQQQLMQLQMIHQLQQQLVNSGGPTEQFPTTLLNGQFGSSFPGLNLSMAALQRAAAGERTRSSQSSSEHDSQSPDSDSDSGNEEKEKSQPYTPPIMSRTHSPSYTPITEQDPGNTEHEVSPMSLLMMAASKAGGLASSSASSAGLLDFSRSSKVNAAKRTAPLFLKPCWVKLDKKVDLVSEKKKPKNLHIPRCCPLCVRDGIRKVYKRIGDHVRRVHKLMGASLKILLSEQRARTHRSKRPYYTCPFCGQYIINRSQHLVNVHHMEKTDIDYVVARSEFRKVEKDGDSHDENGLGNATEEFPYLTRHYCLGLMPNARVMSCRRGFSIVDDYVTFIRSRLGGSVKPAEAKEARMKVNRFLALCGYTEGSDLRAVLCRKSIEVHNNYISRYHRPGTVRSAISNVKTFLKWLKDEGQVNSHVVDDAFRHLTGGLMSKNQDVRRREMECTALPASSSDSDSASSSDTDYASFSDSDYIPETEKSRITKAANESFFSLASNPHANIGQKRVKVSFEETMEIKRCFMDEILQSARTGKTISINTVREKRTLHMSRLTDNQIREKVRNLVKVQKDFSQ